LHKRSIQRRNKIGVAASIEMAATGAVGRRGRRELHFARLSYLLFDFLRDGDTRTIIQCDGGMVGNGLALLSAEGSIAVGQKS
jgi:hypothetical protein